MTTEQKNKSNMPLASSRSRSISLAVFNNEYGKSVVLQKSYLPKEEKSKLKDGEKAEAGAWKRSSINLFMNELADLKKCVDEIYEANKAEIETSKK